MSNVLTPLAEILVQQPLKDRVAAPCFNYYAMTTGENSLIPSPVPLAPSVLHTELTNRITEAATAATVNEQKFTLQKMASYVSKNLKPSP